MKYLISFLILVFGLQAKAQTIIPGRVINKENQQPLAYAQLQIKNGDQLLTNIDGSFSISLEGDTKEVMVSYVGFETKVIEINKAIQYLQISLSPKREYLETVLISNKPDPADGLIKKAIANRKKNDPEKALKAYSYTSYSKFIIDNESGSIKLNADSTALEMKTIMNEGRGYLSEKVSEHYYTKKSGEKERVTGIETAGFRKPVYNVLALEVNPLSLYKEDYKLFKTAYAGPLAKNALKNYDYKILDTTGGPRPAYMIYFKPKREHIVAGLEGILYLDTKSLAIQRAKAQLLGAVKLEVNHNYKYFPEHNIWFPSNQTTTIRPGKGGKEIAVFGGTISIGTLQRKKGAMELLFPSDEISKDLFLSSSIANYNFNLGDSVTIRRPGAEIEVENNAVSRTAEFWKNNRQSEFDLRDQITRKKVDSLIRLNNIDEKINKKNALTTGSYPIGFWDMDLSKVFKFNNYEGIRIGFGGQTNDKFSENFNLKGYTTYGFKDEKQKYGIGTEFYLNQRTGTSLNLFYSRDIRETANFKYLKGQNTFAILEPRFVNINFFYDYRTYWSSIEHKITPKIDSELRIGREEISQIFDYAYLNNEDVYTSYNLNLATLSFLWRPFSKFLSTPENTILVEKGFPQVTGQIQQSFAGMGGDFNFTRIGLKIEHEIKRLDRSRTEFILEGNYGFGDLPLTHAFHSNPNNPNRTKIFRRFSVAGRNSFETMYFNEFYSDRQAMLHLRHQFRPLRITTGFEPELVIISRHAIGDMKNTENHLNTNFSTLEHGFSEAGVELNKLFGGFGLSSAYRYGAYNLPTFLENFSFKFTLQLQL